MSIIMDLICIHRVMSIKFMVVCYLFLKMLVPTPLFPTISPFLYMFMDQTVYLTFNKLYINSKIITYLTVNN